MTKCLILAAGEGKRLRPYTNNIPKALVPFLGKSLITYQLDALLDHGIKNIAISTGYKASAFDDSGYDLFFNSDFNKTNMVESLIAARSFIQEAQEDLIISYGDIIYQKNNLEKVIKKDGDIVVMVDDDWLDLWSVRNEDPLIDAETMKFDKNSGRIIEVGKKPKSLNDIESQYTGLIKISKHKINDFLQFYDGLDRNILYDNKTFPNMYMTSFLQLLIDANWEIVPANVNHGWLEFDTVNDLKTYELLKNNGGLDVLWRNDK